MATKSPKDQSWRHSAGEISLPQLLRTVSAVLRGGGLTNWSSTITDEECRKLRGHSSLAVRTDHPKLKGGSAACRIRRGATGEFHGYRHGCRQFDHRD